MSTLATPLFNPFVRIAGATSLYLGLGIILVSCWLGSFSGLHFDGVLDAHVGGKVHVWIFLAEGVIDWLSPALVLLAAGRLVSKSAFRAVDLIGTQALARWPMIFVALAALAPGFHRFTAQLLESVKAMATDPAKFTPPPMGADAVIFGVVTLTMLACTVWMVALMWKSFSHCCNVRGGRAVVAFVVGLLVAEVVSKVLIGLLFRMA